MQSSTAPSQASLSALAVSGRCSRGRLLSRRRAYSFLGPWDDVLDAAEDYAPGGVGFVHLGDGVLRFQVCLYRHDDRCTRTRGQDLVEERGLLPWPRLEV